MKKAITVFLLVMVMADTSPAQNYEVLYSPLTTINHFKSIKINGEALRHMYFRPNGTGGSPCTTLDSMNQNVYRILPNGQIYTPYNGMLDRRLCNDTSGGCVPIAMQVYDVSSKDTNFVFGLRTVEGSSYYPDCPDLESVGYFTYNGGASVSQSPFLYKTLGVDIAPLKDSIVMVATNFTWPYSMYRSTDRGAGFSSVAILFTYLTGMIRFSTANDRYVFAGTTSGLYRSTNYGAGFSRVDGVQSFSDIAFDDGAAAYGISFSGVFRSLNNGQTWTQIFTGQCTSIQLDPDNDSIIYVGTTNGVFRSTNKGASFFRQGFSFPVTNNIMGLSKDEGSGDTLIVCTQIAIYKVWDLETNIEVTNTIPAKYRLHQNYPNPFNPSTNISFDLPERSEVSLVIYDLLGRVSAEIVNAELISGNYTYTWDASNRSSGVYYARFTARGISGSTYSDSKKLLLIK